MNSHLFLPQALRCLRGSKRVEKKADRLFAQLETVKGILDRIANSQTDRLVRRTNTQTHGQSGVSDNTCCWPTPVNVTHIRTRQQCCHFFFFFFECHIFLEYKLHFLIFWNVLWLIFQSDTVSIKHAKHAQRAHISICVEWELHESKFSCIVHFSHTGGFSSHVVWIFKVSMSFLGQGGRHYELSLYEKDLRVLSLKYLLLPPFTLF